MGQLTVIATIFDPSDAPGKKTVHVMKQQPSSEGVTLEDSKVIKVKVWVYLAGEDSHMIRQVDYLFPSRNIVGQDYVTVARSFDNLNLSYSFWTSGDFTLKLYLRYRNWEKRMISVPLNILSQLKDNEYAVKEFTTVGEHFYTIR